MVRTKISHLRYFVAHKHTLGYLEVIILFFNWYQSGYTCVWIYFLSVIHDFF
jgi:hypothetical protein